MRCSLFLLLVFLWSCAGEDVPTTEEPIPLPDTVPDVTVQTDAVTRYAQANPNDSIPSIAEGSVSSGALQHGKLVPFSGPNFFYFDSASYVGARAFTHQLTLNTILDAYAALAENHPERTFVLMECSNRNGGKMFPHRTHQNGLSVDFMMPVLKNGEPYQGLDRMGAAHYFIDFNDEGRYTADTSVIIDFELVAQHLLQLDEAAAGHGLKIKKVIIKTELKDELFATESGKALKRSDIYVVRSLTPLINGLHDDHYHVDFEIIN